MNSCHKERSISEVSLEADDVSEFYDANKSSFVTEKSVALEYVLLTNDIWVRCLLLRGRPSGL